MAAAITLTIVPKLPEIWASRFWASRFSEIWISRILEIQISNHQIFENSTFHKIGYPDFPKSGFQCFWIFEFHLSHELRNPNFKGS